MTKELTRDKKKRKKDL